MGFLSGPQPPQNNPPIHPEWYVPSRFVISAITKGLTTTVTMLPTTIEGVTTDPNYVVGQEVRINIPRAYGMIQMNERNSMVISIPSSTEVILNLDSRLFNDFIASPTDDSQEPQIMAIGDFNSGAINASGRINLGTYIPGSFRDISPA